MKILFICTSQKDRSPALEKYFREVYPQHEYKSAGINKYFCGQKGTHYLTQEDIDWADLIVFAEQIHKDISYNNFIFTRKWTEEEIERVPKSHKPLAIYGEKEIKEAIILNCGNYLKGTLHDDYLTCAEQKLERILKQTT